MLPFLLFVAIICRHTWMCLSNVSCSITVILAYILAFPHTYIAWILFLQKRSSRSTKCNKTFIKSLTQDIVKINVVICNHHSNSVLCHRLEQFIIYSKSRRNYHCLFYDYFYCYSMRTVTKVTEQHLNVDKGYYTKATSLTVIIWIDIWMQKSVIQCPNSWNI